MQQIKFTNNFSDLKEIISNPEKMTSSLTDMIDIFNLKKHFVDFNSLKSKGLAVSSILSLLIILPFYGLSSIYALFKSGINSKDFEGNKDAYYQIKNNENINWRLLLILHGKRFKYLVNNNKNTVSKKVTAIIFDDTTIEKTGKKIEKISFVNNHVTGRFILGFKLLVCGFWDGESFIPLDFSLHREKGKKQENLIKEYRKSLKKSENIKNKLIIAQKTIKSKKELFYKAKKNNKFKSNRTNIAKLDNSKVLYQKAKEKLKGIIKENSNIQKYTAECKKNIRKYYAKDKLFGLTNKERKEQYKKSVSKDSQGNTRRRECDIDKISNMITMLKRVVKNGFIADYLLCDSWFFCMRLLKEITKIKKGVIKLITMVKINGQIFTNINKKKICVNNMPEVYRKQKQYCRKLKADYIKINAYYHGIRVNLFFVKIGKTASWHLLLTTDLKISFVKLMEVYHIRWSIEVYFKESKQYLNLENCKSSIFDAHIADITISMMQHIMLSYLKRINYMQTMGDLFKDAKKEISQIDLITKILEIFWQIIELMCKSSGFDFIEFQKDILNNDEFLESIVKLLPDKKFNNAA